MLKGLWAGEVKNMTEYKRWTEDQLITAQKATSTAEEVTEGMIKS